MLKMMWAGPNPLSGKPHSASSAEAVVETDPEYAAFLKRRRAAAVTKQVAYGRMESARLRAELCRVLLQAAPGFRSAA